MFRAVITTWKTSKGLLFTHEVLAHFKLRPVEEFYTFEPYQLRDAEALKSNLEQVGFSNVEYKELSTFINVTIEDHLNMAWQTASALVGDIAASVKDEFLSYAREKLQSMSHDRHTVDFEAIAIAMVCTK